MIHDTETHLKWYVGPDKDTTWDDAKGWVESLNYVESYKIAGGGWRMPTLKEMRGLYQKGKGTCNMNPVFKTTGHYVWSGQLESSSYAWNFNFPLGGELLFPRSFSRHYRAFAVCNDSKSMYIEAIETAGNAENCFLTTSDIPQLVRVYGMIIMVLSAISMGSIALQSLQYLALGGSPGMLIFSALCVGICFVGFRCGKGLRAGERQAVYGLCIFGGLNLLVAIGQLGTGKGVGQGLFTLTVVGVLFVPPIISAFSHWSAFKYNKKPKV